MYKTPWAGDPRVNIQGEGGKAKAYIKSGRFWGHRTTGGGTQRLRTIDTAIG
jgi:hypothetical protein